MTSVPDDYLDAETGGSVTTVLETLAAVANDDKASEGRPSEKRILLVGRPRSIAKWDLRWLQRSGYELTLVDKPDSAMLTARAVSPAVILVEAECKNHEKQPVYSELLEAFSSDDTPIFILTTSSKDVRAALDLGAYDVARKPFEWRSLGRRVRRAAETVRQKKGFEATKSSLKSALAIAEKVRHRSRSTENFEPVTGLPNRIKFEELLRRNVKSVTDNLNVLLTLVVSLNRFNLITEALGTEKSDLVAGKTADILKGCLESAADAVEFPSGLRTASVARIAPGRFALMMTASTGAEELELLRRSLVEKLSAPMILDGQTLYLSPCVGAAAYPTDVSNLSQLLLKAESAMRNARSKGMQFARHTHRNDTDFTRRLELENRLHQAVEKSELKLVYQPLVDIASDNIVGCEALLRWPQRNGSFISPGEFVPIAEASGLMVQIGEFVLRSACEQLAAWQREGIGPMRMSVNVSKCQLESERFTSLVAECLEEYGIDPVHLDLELSERGTLSPGNEIHERLHALKKLGVSLSIDDFGTGEAAIAYLKDLPVDVLKIDRSYVMELKSDGTKSAMTSAMVALGQKMNLTVVAEGVESDEQLAVLRSMGCDQYQGFFRSPAVDPDALADMLRNGI